MILIGRSALPARDEWDDWLTMQALEDLSAEVWVARADVANLQQMQEVITIAEKRFGQLNGLIHAAGMLKEFHTIEQTDNGWKAGAGDSSFFSFQLSVISLHFIAQ